MRMLLALAICAGLVGCGKKDSPVPPGPPDQVKFPKLYPTQ